MSTGDVIDLVRLSVVTLIKVSAAPLIVSVVVGLVVSILQTATSIQEQTLSFVPKIVAVLASLVFFGHEILGTLLDFSNELLSRIARM